MRAAILAALWSLGCDSQSITGLPAGAVPMTPPSQYGAWWTLTEQCSGRTGDPSAVQWYYVPGATSFSLEGETVNGAWYSDGNRIVIAAESYGDGALVRHEMLHALLRVPGHPRDQFLDHCGDIVACIEQCVTNAGGPPDTSTAAPVVGAAAMRITTLIAPDTETSTTDGGWFTATVSATNPSPRAVRVAITSKDSYEVRLVSLSPGGPGGYMGEDKDAPYVTFAPAGQAGATRRYVFDLYQRAVYGLEPGRYSAIGTFAGVDAAPEPFTLTP